MAGYSTVQSAMRLAAIMVGAGTVLGLASHAAAQSRVERRHVENAQRDGEQRVEVIVNDDDDQPRERAKKIQRRIEIRGDGEGMGGDGRCPVCGGPMGGEGKRKIERRIELRGVPEGMHGGVHAFRVDGDGEPHAFAFGGGEGGAHVFGKAIVVGPDGEKREFNFGDTEGGGGRPRVFTFGGNEGGGGRPHVFRFDDDAEGGHAFRLGEHEGGGGKPHLFRFNGGGEGGHVFKFDGDADVTGKVIIIGPDGRSREFNLDGQGGKGGKAGKGERPFIIKKRMPQIEIESNDGPDVQAHPDGQRTIQVRLRQRGGTV